MTENRQPPLAIAQMFCYDSARLGGPGSGDAMRFIDLFAGLGGFHLALRNLGHQCVFACEIDETLRELYQRNFGLEAAGDLRQVDASDIPDHDILCAGFPCQPFSKAGRQSGLKDPELGGLYLQILRVIRHHRPGYLILENVPNLEMHDNGRTWEVIEGLLQNEGYDVRRKRLSPHQYGIPQIRDRMYIVGSRQSLDGFEWPAPTSKSGDVSLKGALDANPPDARQLSSQVQRCLRVWQEFLDLVPETEKIPHPLWSMEFGATYPYEDATPAALGLERMRQYRGAYGNSLAAASSMGELLSLLPSHARVTADTFPRWKVDFIRKNRAFYQKHRAWLDPWKLKVMEFPSSFQKLEWNCQGEASRSLGDYIIQMRASGVRVKRPTTAPSLIAMTATQVPVVTWESRYMTPAECLRLQNMEGIRLPQSVNKAYEALGNAVNVRVAELVADALVERSLGNEARSGGSLWSPAASA